MTHHPDFLRIRAERTAAIRGRQLERLAHNTHLAYSWLVTRAVGYPFLLVVGVFALPMILGSRLLGRGR